MIKAVVLDLDGTVYNGDQMIYGADQAINNMRKQGIRVFFCTNNSSKMPFSISNKLNKMGIVSKNEDIITSGMMAIEYVMRKNLEDVYISGSPELKEAFFKSGIKLCEEEEAKVLVIGMNPNFDYDDMTKGMRAALISKEIIACNLDRNYERENGLFPGNGGMVSAILHCSNRKANVIVGKPNTLMLQFISEKYGIASNEMIVIGDSEESDIGMANNYGCRSILINGGNRRKNAIHSLYETIRWSWIDYNWK